MYRMTWWTRNESEEPEISDDETDHLESENTESDKEVLMKGKFRYRITSSGQLEIGSLSNIHVPSQGSM